MTYIGDYAFTGFAKDCEDYHEGRPQDCLKFMRTKDPRSAKKILEKYEIPEDALVVPQEMRGKRTYEFLYCSP